MRSLPSAGLVESAVYVEGGLGISFGHAAHGLTMLVPIPAPSIDQSLQDGLPGENGKAFRIKSDETLAPNHNQLPFFEATMARAPASGRRARTVTGVSSGRRARTVTGVPTAGHGSTSSSFPRRWPLMLQSASPSIRSSRSR